MANDTGKLLLLGGLAYLFLRNSSSGIPMATAVTPGYYPNSAMAISAGQKDIQTVASSPLQAEANQEVNQQIQTQNVAISSVGSVATAAIGVLASIHVLAASVAGPIGLAIAGIVLLVKALLSDTHLVANELVQKYENPFANYFIQVISAVSNAYSNHTLSLATAQLASEALTQSWNNYESTMHQLMQTSSDWNIVAMQSLNNLNNEYMGVTLSNGKTLGAGEGGTYGSTPNYGFVSSWLDWLNINIIQNGGLS